MRTKEFEKELKALLKKYDAQLKIKTPQHYIEAETIEVFFNSVWDGNSCVDECRALDLGNEVVP